MSDGDSRSIKGKAIAVDYEISTTSSPMRSRSSSHAVDGHDDGNGVDFLPTTNLDGRGSTSSLPSPDMDTRVYIQQQVDPNPSYRTTGNGGGPQHVRTGNQYTGIGGNQYTGIGCSTHRVDYAGASASAGATFPTPHIGYGMHGAPPRSPLQWSMEQMDSFIGSSLRALSIRDDRGHGSLLARGGRRLSELASNSQERRGLQLGTDGRNSPFIGGHRGLLIAADQYAGRRLEDVRGTMRSIAKTLRGCQFLVRMVAEGGAATAKQVLDEVAGDIVGLMVHKDGHALVEALVDHLSDEHIAHVLRILDAASPAQIVAVGRNHAGSNILQTLIGRTARNPGHAEFFTRTLSRVGQMGVLSLIGNMDGSRLVMRCLQTFSAAQNQFITVAMAMSLDRVCRDRHGCHVMIKCIDMLAGVGEQAWSSFVRAVCWDGWALAEHGYGNYVVQHVIRRVPGARGSLHAAFRGRYVSLSTQMASSHVVQRCLEFFSPEQADEIVGELLGCGFTFMRLIDDRFANYVLQTAMDRREIQMHNTLLDAILVHRHELRVNMFARNVYHKLYTIRGLNI